MQDSILIDAIWLSTAFLMGFIVKKFHLPSLIGFLITGLILNSLDLAQGSISQLLDTLSSLGVMLLLFTIGLKIKVNNILKPEIWVSASINMFMSVLIIGGFIFMLSICCLVYDICF